MAFLILFLDLRSNSNSVTLLGERITDLGWEHGNAPVQVRWEKESAGSNSKMRVRGNDRCYRGLTEGELYRIMLR